MSKRMYSDPPSNFQFWDWAEIGVLEEYLTRFHQEVVYTGRDKYFQQNWANCLAAYNYAINHLLPNYICDNPEILKQAIRDGRAVSWFTSFVDGCD